MSEIIAQLMTTELKTAIVVCIVVLVILYILSIVWVARDAYLRATNWKFWALISIIPVAGIIAYCLLRPPLLQIDKDEQELEIAIKRRELRQYGECGSCGYPVEADYILCPNCLQRLKNMCPVCHRACEPAWTVCPYCTTPIPDGGVTVRQANPRRIGSPQGAGTRSERAPRPSARAR